MLGQTALSAFYSRLCLSSELDIFTRHDDDEATTSFPVYTRDEDPNKISKI